MIKMEKYRIGYGRVDVTPLENVPQAGFGNTDRHISTEVHDPIMASCFAITDQADTTVLLICVDLQRADITTVTNARENIERELGVPGDHVMVCTTHTHAGPEMFRPDMPQIARYRPRLDEGILLAAKLAMFDRREADIYMGQIETERMNFIKHYAYEDENGQTKYFGDIFGTATYNETTRHVTEVDPTMHVLKIVRQGVKELVLVNWRAHGHVYAAAKRFDISADFPGFLRSAFESRYDGLITYFQGACGNVNAHTRLEHEKQTRVPEEYGNLLADYVIKVLEGEMTLVRPKPIGIMQTVLKEPINLPTPEFYDNCIKVQKLWRETNSASACRELGQPLGIRSHAMANAVIARTKRGQYGDLELNAITLGDIGIVTAPNELFDTLSVYVEEHAPFKKVLTFGYANNAQGYIPSAYGFQYSCYESDCCYFLPGIGEKIRDTHLQMLNKLKQEQE